MSIIRMLRATLIGRTPEAEATLAAVQAAGLLHIVPMRPPEQIVAVATGGDDVLARVAALQRARDAITSLVEQPPVDGPNDLDALAAHVAELLAERDRCTAEAAGADATIGALEPWGEFDPADLAMLAAHGAPVTFARLTANDWLALDVANVPHAIVHQSELEVFVVLFGAEAAELPLTPLRLPAVRLSDAVAERDALRARLREIAHELGGLAHRVADIDALLATLEDRAAVLRALGGALDEGEIFAVQGYVPAENQVDLQRAVEPFNAVLLLDDPEPGEQVPVKLRLLAPIEGFGAIVQAFSGISYWEKDFTPAVMLLFLVFGSLCLLDGGYGILLALTGLGLLYKGHKAFGSVFAITGVFATAVGIIGGQYFGLILGKDFMVGHQPPSQLATDPMTTFIFSLVVGMIGMTLSYATAVWQRGWRTSATGSLLFALGANALAAAKVGAAGLAKLFVAEPSPELVAGLSDNVSTAGAVLLVGGVLGWIAYPDETFGEGKRGANFAWQFYSGATGFAQDVMSHMRLFGIALSGSIMAMVVNQIAGLLPLVGTVLFAIVGHLFVFVLSVLSLYIHTNRLIFLEFGSKCFDGGQSWYQPLQRGSASAQQAAA